MADVTEARRPAHDYWFAFFGAHSDPKGRLLCVGTALVCLGFPLADVLSGRLSPGSELVAGAGLAAFAALYLRLFWILPSVATERRAEGFMLLGAVAALAIALSVAFGDEWLVLLIYLGVAVALALPARFALPAIAAVAGIAVATTGEIDLAVQIVSFGVLLVAVRRLMELVRELEAARAQVAELAAGEERLRLSRDMHDLLGHNLSVIALKSQLARKLLGRDPSAAEGAAELDRAREALETAGIEVEVRTTGPLPARVEAVLGFAAREGATNVVRHSGAARCEIVVRRVGDSAELELRDDGIGAVSASGQGTGLRGLAERMAEAGGRLEASPAEGGGFLLLARVPIATSLSPRDASETEALGTP